MDGTQDRTRFGLAAGPWIVVGLVVVVSAAALLWRRPAPVATPVARPPVVVAPVRTPEAMPLATPAPAPVPVPVPDLPTPIQQPVASETKPSVALQSIQLADGRRFIGLHDPVAGVIVVRAAVRGGTVTRMQDITVRVEQTAVSSVTAYDGSLGDLGGPYVPAPVDPARAAAVDSAREASAARAAQRREEAAEQERERQRLTRRAAAAQRVDDAKADLQAAGQREQFLAGHAKTLDDDRRLKLELINGLQLQFNTAQDRWNQEVQTLGPRVTKPDGTLGGGPTQATEALFNNLQQQIQQARKAVAAIEASIRAEAEERQELVAGMPRLTAAVEAATQALAGLP